MNSTELMILRTELLVKAKEHEEKAVACRKLAGEISDLAIKVELAEDAARVLLGDLKDKHPFPWLHEPYKGYWYFKGFLDKEYYKEYYIEYKKIRRHN